MSFYNRIHGTLDRIGFVKENFTTKPKDNNNIKVINSEDKFKIIISKPVMDKVNYLHNRFPNLEWGGFMFLESNNADKIKNLIYTAVDLYPLDLGTGTFTSYTQDEAFSKFMVDNLDYMDYKLALFHTHHSMGAFFSGTDTNTLYENIDNMNSVISIVGDIRNTWQAKYGFKIENRISYKLDRKESITYDLNNQKIEHSNDGEIENTYSKSDIQYKIYNAEFEYETGPTLDSHFIELVDKLDKSKNRGTSNNIQIRGNNNIQINPKHNLNQGYGELFPTPNVVNIGPEESIESDEIIELIDPIDEGIIEIYKSSFEFLIKALSLNFNINTNMTNVSYDKWVTILNTLIQKHSKGNKVYSLNVAQTIFEAIDNHITLDDLEYLAADIFNLAVTLGEASKYNSISETLYEVYEYLNDYVERVEHNKSGMGILDDLPF